MLFTHLSKWLVCLSVVLAVAEAVAEPVTSERIRKLPSSEQDVWKAYWERSKSKAAADMAVIESELAANRMARAVRAPSGGDFKLRLQPGDPWFGSEEAGRLADAVLSYQTPSGGWSKKTGFNRGPRKPGMLWSSQHDPGRPPHYVATFDNSSTTSQMDFLAAVWLATRREDCKKGFLKGLEFILAAQYPNGGWPQVYPLEGDYHDDITFNDDAMTHVLELLQGIVRNEPCYAFVDDAKRREAARALEEGLQCVLRTQLVMDGRKTVWCAQYDALTLAPASARKMEPATLSGLESAHILRFLMTLPNPSPEIRESIEAGLAWLENAKVTGLAKTNRDGRTTFESNPDSVEVYWARFYSLETGKPVFPGRDGVVYDTYAEMAASNRLGYDFLTTLPGSILNNGQKKWRKMISDPAR